MLLADTNPIKNSQASDFVKRIFASLYKLRLLLFCCCLLVLSGIAWFYFDNYKENDPIYIAKEFLCSISKGDIKKAKSYFGGKCACLVPGGWVSYLLYKSGQEPNLAYLVGKNFPIENFCKGPEISEPQDPFTKLCRVTVPITFSEDTRPYFLPVKMAFGKTMDESEFLHFSNDPYKEWQKGFTLRIRPSISKGTINQPNNIETTNTNSAVLSTYEKNSQSLFRLLGDEVVSFLPPTDAGTVICSDKTFLKQKEIELLLPRIRNINLDLLLIRKPHKPNWQIMECKSTEAVLQVGNGSLAALKEPTKNPL